MLPYNSKIWAYPLHLLRAEWISGRVSGVEGNLRVNSLARFRDKKPWGDNAIFRYPLQGGIGEIFKRIADLSYEKIKYNTEVVRVDPRHKIIYLSNGQEDKYSVLINTSPLDKFLGSIQWPGKNLADISLRLKHNGVLVVGLGIHRPCPSNKSWVYFPEDKFPFHRVTYLSNYSPGNVPDNNQYFSLLCETAYSEYKKVSKSNIVEMTIQGLIKSGILQKNSKRFIVSKFLFDMDYAYPLPTLETENALAKINPLLEKMSIYSRGRFGSGRYRVGNLDHCIMQGKNLVDRLLTKSKKLPKACG
jgi:protoporphyrinogen oxidase